MGTKISSIMTFSAIQKAAVTVADFQLKINTMLTSFCLMLRGFRVLDHNNGIPSSGSNIKRIPGGVAGLLAYIIPVDCSSQKTTMKTD